jgi:mannose-1-phosphate guanylyltransferase
MSIIPVIMAGGSGSRLWPLSRALFPKQFLSLLGEGSLLQQTIERLSNLDAAYPLVICNEEHRFVVAEQLRQIGKLAGNIILEPVGRNTAPAIALAAIAATAKGDDPLLLVLAADHAIQNTRAFELAVQQAKPAATDGKLVTFGIVPAAPETGYGYIHKGADQSKNIYSVAQFVEKPDLATAKKYVTSGDYLWNSGMFLFKASRYLQELEAHRPDILLTCREAMRHVDLDLDFVRIDEEAFSKCPEDSIDYAVMEKTKDAVVVPLDAGWSDIGSWSALWEVSKKDGSGNALHGDVILHDTHNSYIHAEKGLVAAVGLNDIVVVQTKDAVLVAHKDKVQDVKKIVDSLKSDDRSEFKHQREIFRPWGKYDAIDSGARYQVKRITVKPGAKLSVQMHHHRAEHWIVVSGIAKATVGENTFFISENESTYIPIGIIHALENPGKVDLELIEVQSGTYLGEDDIVRFEDKYGRV